MPAALLASRSSRNCGRYAVLIFGTIQCRAVAKMNLYSTMRHDGVYRWYLNRAVPLLDADGSALRWFGSSTDVEQAKARGAPNSARLICCQALRRA